MRIFTYSCSHIYSWPVNAKARLMPLSAIQSSSSSQRAQFHQAMEYETVQAFRSSVCRLLVGWIW
jgi:hypothetical protein